METKKELTILEQIAQLQNQLTAKQQAELNNINKTTAVKFEEKEKQTTTEIKTFLENKILEAINEAREEIQNKFDSCEWLETCIDTTKQYISIGVTQFNPKTIDNKSDKNIKVTCSFRTFQDISEEANKKQDKDVNKNIRLSSHDKKEAHNRANIDVEKTLKNIAKRSNIKVK
ncbi:hypothetical protein [uncultured Mediterranean phage uvMED]|nr:hypothetical protein [uncultured Mediterranean phage uvMED]